MKSKFQQIRLRDICSLVTDGTHNSPKLQSQGLPFILILADFVATAKNEIMLPKLVFRRVNYDRS